MVHLVCIFSVMLVKTFQVPENKISLPNLVCLAYRIVFPMALQDDTLNPWISKLMTQLPFWEKLLVKAAILGTRFNNRVLWCPLRPCTEQPIHQTPTALSLDTETITLSLFLNLSHLLWQHCCPKNLKGFLIVVGGGVALKKVSGQIPSQHCLKKRGTSTLEEQLCDHLFLITTTTLGP